MSSENDDKYWFLHPVSKTLMPERRRKTRSGADNEPTVRGQRASVAKIAPASERSDAVRDLAVESKE